MKYTGVLDRIDFCSSEKWNSIVLQLGTERKTGKRQNNKEKDKEKRWRNMSLFFSVKFQDILILCVLSSTSLLLFISKFFRLHPNLSCVSQSCCDLSVVVFFSVCFLLLLFCLCGDSTAASALAPGQTLNPDTLICVSVCVCLTGCVVVSVEVTAAVTATAHKKKSLNETRMRSWVLFQALNPKPSHFYWRQEWEWLCVCLCARACVRDKEEERERGRETDKSRIFWDVFLPLCSQRLDESFTVICFTQSETIVKMASHTHAHALLKHINL